MPAMSGFASTFWLRSLQFGFGLTLAQSNTFQAIVGTQAGVSMSGGVLVVKAK